MADIELSSYVTSLASATLTGTEEVYLVGDEKTTTQDIADLNGNLITTIVNIGDWDMDATGSVSIAHGITDYSKIRSVSVLIIPDAAATLIDLNSCDSLGNNSGYVGQIQSANISLFRVATGQFDSVNYDTTPFNRGYITIQHIP